MSGAQVYVGGTPVNSHFLNAHILAESFLFNGLIRYFQLFPITYVGLQAIIGKKSQLLQQKHALPIESRSQIYRTDFWKRLGKLKTENYLMILKPRKLKEFDNT